MRAELRARGVNPYNGREYVATLKGGGTAIVEVWEHGAAELFRYREDPGVPESRGSCELKKREQS